MKIIISPAKKMNIDTDMLSYHNQPVYLEQTEKLLTYLKSLSYDEAKTLWGCSDKLAEENYRRLQNTDLHRLLTPAIISYEGIQYQYMAPAVFSSSHLAYIENHLRILSGFYGILKPFDGVVPYRLEMQAKAKVNSHNSLYEFWGSLLYDELVKEESHPVTIINLASKEYSKCMEAYLKPEDRYITCIFGELLNGKVKQKGTLAKMARGEMVRFMAENNIERPEDIQNFQGLGFSYRKDLSSETEYVFIKAKDL